MNFEKKNSENQIIIEGKTFEVDKEGLVNFGEVSRGLLNKQAQYGFRYVDGAFGEYPKLGEGLRFKGNTDDYHNLKIHKDDIREFVERFRKYQKEQKD